MSIIAYVGLPGAGKTYGVVKHQILPALKAGRIIVTNVPVKVDLIKADMPKSDLGTPIDIRDFPLETIAGNPELMAEAVPPGAILVLDEVWRLFPSGSKANQVPEQFRSFFAEHRHRMDAAGNSTQIVLVTQDLAQIGAFARQLVEQTYRMIKLSTLGIPSSNRYRVDIYPGSVAGANPPAAQRLRQIQGGRYDKKIFQYYVSHTQSEAGEGTGINEAGVDKRANVFKSPFFIFVPILCIVVACVIWFKGGYLMDKYRKKPEPVVAVSAGRAGGAASALPAPQRPSEPSVISTALAKFEGAGDWVVIGTIKNEEHPDRSLGVLRSAKEKKNVTVALDKCLLAVHEPTRCLFAGFWYSEVGPAQVVGTDGTVRPLPVAASQGLIGTAPVAMIR